MEKNQLQASSVIYFPDFKSPCLTYQMLRTFRDLTSSFPATVLATLCMALPGLQETPGAASVTQSIYP